MKRFSFLQKQILRSLASDLPVPQGMEMSENMADLWHVQTLISYQWLHHKDLYRRVQESPALVFYFSVVPLPGFI